MSNSLYSIYQYNHLGIRVVPNIDKDKEIYFNVYAYKRQKGVYSNELLIMKISENENKNKVRWDNICFSPMGGWRVVFPGEKTYDSRYCSEGEIQKKGKMIKTKENQLPNMSVLFVHYNNFDELYEMDTRLTYLLRALESQRESLSIKHIKFYRKYGQEMEMLIKNGYPRFAIKESIYKLKPELKKKLYKRLQEKISELCTYNDVLYAIRNDIAFEDVGKHKAFMKYGIPSFTKLKSYLEENDERLYGDYIAMAKELNRDLGDPYWAYPKNLNEMHDKVMEEKSRIDAAKIEKEFAGIVEVSNKLRKKYNPATINGYEIDFPKDIADIQTQAKILKQCLITANYHKNYLDNKLILVFIKKDGKRLATAEIKSDKSIGQFYGDEYDRSNCLPSPEVEKAFYEWYDENFKRRKNETQISRR